MIRLSRVAQRVMFLLLSMSCVSCASMHGTWYYQTKDADPESWGLYLAILYDADAQDISSVEVNSAGEKGTERWVKCVNQQMRRGQLLVVEMPSDGHKCDVPIDARLIIGNGCDQSIEGRPATGSIRVRLSGSMPTALPVPWLNCPSPPASTVGDGKSAQ